MSSIPATRYDITKDPFFAALNQGSAAKPGPVAPPPGFKTYAEQGAQLAQNVDNFLIDYTFQSLSNQSIGQGPSYAPGSDGAFLQSLASFGDSLSQAAGQLADLGGKVNTHA